MFFFSREERCLVLHPIMHTTFNYRFYGVMVSTLDSESSDPSSNLGRTFFLLLFVCLFLSREERGLVLHLIVHTTFTYRFYGVMVSTLDSESEFQIRVQISVEPSFFLFLYVFFVKRREGSCSSSYNAYNV